MGSKLENVNKKVESANQNFEQAMEQGEKDVSEVNECKSILDGMDMDVDEDIIAAMENTRGAVKSEGASHMNSEVHAVIDSGNAEAQDAINEGTDQSSRSRKNADMFSSMSGVTEFGSSSAEQSAATAEGVAEQFDEMAEVAQQSMEDAEHSFQEQMNDLLS